MPDVVPILLATNLITFALIARWYAWPWLKSLPMKEAAIVLLLPHTMRFIGLMFLAEGAVKTPLPTEFAYPAAIGDSVAALLAYAAIFALRRGGRLGYSLAGVAHGFGLVDLLSAVSLGVASGAPGGMGAAIWIPSVLVPLLLTTHALGLKLLFRCQAEKRRQAIAVA